MSKYSRTRKAICRISHLSSWATRSEFKRGMYDTMTWKQSFRKARKDAKIYYEIDKKVSLKYGFSKPEKPIILRYNYKEAREKFPIWRLI